tara:strand:+ start:57 stop:815 length:759 start_codon:yes stop_codon:yes gene_type:complete
VINNKKVFLTYIFCFFLFITFYIFPNYSDKPRLFIFSLKSVIEKPFNHIGLNFNNYFKLLKSKQDLLIALDKLNKKNEYLKNMNNYFRILTSKYVDQYRVFHDTHPPVPSSVGVSVIGERDLFYSNDFIINKGSKSGIEISDYVIDGIYIIGRIKSVNFNSSLVVTVKSIDYGDEVIIDGNSYIVSGTNNNYLSFLRQKNNNQQELVLGKKAIVEKNNINLILGQVSYIEDQPVIYSKNIFNLNNLRVITDD